MRSCDTDPIRALKLDVLTTIATESSIHAILQEFQVDRLSCHGVFGELQGCSCFEYSKSLKCISSLAFFVHDDLILRENYIHGVLLWRPKVYSEIRRCKLCLISGLREGHKSSVCCKYC